MDTGISKVPTELDSLYKNPSKLENAMRVKITLDNLR